jgi:hypothetical protein
MGIAMAFIIRHSFYNFLQLETHRSQLNKNVKVSDSAAQELYFEKKIEKKKMIHF